MINTFINDLKKCLISDYSICSRYTSAFNNRLKHQQLLPDIFLKSMRAGNLCLGPLEISDLIFEAGIIFRVPVII